MKWLAAVFMLLWAVPTLAQSNCGSGLPCGQIPWNLPYFVPLESPTPMPTWIVTTTPTATFTPTGTIIAPTETPTLTPTPTVTPVVNADDINDQLATIQSIAGSTQIPINNVDGTPVNSDDMFNELGANTGQLFGYIRGLTTGSYLGQITPLVTYTLVVLALVMFVKSLTFLAPVLAVFIGIIRKIIQLLLDFLPG